MARGPLGRGPRAAYDAKRSPRRIPEWRDIREGDYIRNHAVIDEKSSHKATTAPTGAGVLRRQFTPTLPSVFTASPGEPNLQLTPCTEADLVNKQDRENNAPHTSSEETKKILSSLFPHTIGSPFQLLQPAPSGSTPLKKPLRVGAVLSGGQAAGGHNVICGLFDYVKRVNRDSRVYGFLGGPHGLYSHEYKELTAEIIDHYRNSGGFDMIRSGRHKVETDEQKQRSLEICNTLELDGLVIIGGDDSNTNAAVLAEYFKAKGSAVSVVGCPKTIDGDLKNYFVEISFGFDTACKTYCQLIGCLMEDAKTGGHMYHFVRLMGRSASLITLECAVQTHPNLALIGEEVQAKNLSLQQLVTTIANLVEARQAKGKNYGVILLPEGLIEFIPEVGVLIREINHTVAQGEFCVSKLSADSRRVFEELPESTQQQLLLDRDPHGNVQVAMIHTEKLLALMTEAELKKRQFRGGFHATCHYFGYEGRSGYPSLFDATYCYALGHVAAALLQHGATACMAVLKNMSSGESPTEWKAAGIPLTRMMTLETRKGKANVPVIKKFLVDIERPLFKVFAQVREEWKTNDFYQVPGPLQLPQLASSSNGTGGGGTLVHKGGKGGGGALLQLPYTLVGAPAASTLLTGGVSGAADSLSRRRQEEEPLVPVLLKHKDTTLCFSSSSSSAAPAATATKKEGGGTGGAGGVCPVMASVAGGGGEAGGSAACKGEGGGGEKQLAACVGHLKSLFPLLLEECESASRHKGTETIAMFLKGAYTMVPQQQQQQQGGGGGATPTTTTTSTTTTSSKSEQHHHHHLHMLLGGKGAAGEKMNVGVVLIGRQMPAASNVLLGVTERVTMFKGNVFGFKGAKGLLKNEYILVSEKDAQMYRNLPAFDLLGRTENDEAPLGTAEGLRAAAETVRTLGLDILVIIGWTLLHAATLAELLAKEKSHARVVSIAAESDFAHFLPGGCLRILRHLTGKHVVVGAKQSGMCCPVLARELLELGGCRRLGFDTQTKVAAEMIGNLETDSASATKYYYFCALGGGWEAECEAGLQTHPNIVISSRKWKDSSLQDLVKYIVEGVKQRAAAKKNFGVVVINQNFFLLHRGLRSLAAEIEAQLAKMRKEEEHCQQQQQGGGKESGTKKKTEVEVLQQHLSSGAQEILSLMPKSYQKKIIATVSRHPFPRGLDKFPVHELLSHLVGEALNKEKTGGTFTGSFSPVCFEFTSALSSAFPSYHDCSLGLMLGHLAVMAGTAHDVASRAVHVSIRNPAAAPTQWEPQVRPTPVLAAQAHCLHVSSETAPAETGTPDEEEQHVEACTLFCLADGCAGKMASAVAQLVEQGMQEEQADQTKTGGGGAGGSGGSGSGGGSWTLKEKYCNPGPLQFGNPARDFCISRTLWEATGHQQ